MKLEIITLPNKNLRLKSTKIKATAIEKPEMQLFFKSLISKMLEADGLGLAAPQVDKQIQAVAINTAEKPIVLINPKIIKKSFLKKIGEEGCLSIPQVFGLVKRPEKITIKFLTTENKELELKAEGLLARVIQHEIDHLNGVLFIDKVRKIIQGADILKKINTN